MSPYLLLRKFGGKVVFFPMILVMGLIFGKDVGSARQVLVQPAVPFVNLLYGKGDGKG